MPQLSRNWRRVAIIATALVFGLMAACGATTVISSAPTGGGVGTQPPTISGTPQTAVSIGSAYSFTPVASDPNSKQLTFSILNKPSWLTFTTVLGSLSGVPSSSDTGNFAGITIIVSNGELTATLPAFTISVAASTDDFVPKIDACSSPITGTHATYDIGPGKTYTDTTNFPWLSLQAGDVVNIYYQSTPYRTYIALNAEGTAAAPVIVNGVTDAGCHRPEISGTGAVYAADRGSFDNAYTKTNDVIIVWPGNGNYGRKPSHITIQNLRLTNAASGSYAGGTAINAITSDYLTVQNCEITNNNGWGIFTNTKNDSPAGQETSYYTVIRSNQIYNNGISGSYLYHNLYIQGYETLIEGNYLGALRNGAQGSTLKDRSSGTVIRYNMIVAAARAIDLVETEGGHGTVDADPRYSDAWVYGNLIINDDTIPGAGSADLIHWGYDNCYYYNCVISGPVVARTGTLHFYENTIIANMNSGQWAVFDQQSNGDTINPHNIVELQNNILYNKGSATMTLAIDMGDVRFLANNWISTGWKAAKLYSTTPSLVLVSGQSNLIQGTDPMLDPTTAGPLTGSPVIGQATGGTATPVRYEFALPATVVDRVTAIDLGAFEHH